MRISILLLFFLALAGCSDSDDEPDVPAPVPPTPTETASFEVVVTNLTNAQPLSPVLAALHAEGFVFFEVGAPASAAFERLAEGGSNAELALEVGAASAGLVSQSGAAPIGPGGSESVTLEVDVDDLPGLRLSVAAMLVNTNDAFTAIDGMEIGAMTVGDSATRRSIVYDAGTEANTEALGTIPGPADGGEGFNAARDDRADQVTMHPGVVSASDGLQTSVLDEQQRFDNPAAMIVVRRID